MRLIVAALALAYLLFPGRLAAASPAIGATALLQPKADPAKPKTEAPEAYRIRVSNTLYGAIEVSTDRGVMWYLVGRVVRAATTAVAGAPSSQTTVIRAGKFGAAFGIGGFKLMKLLPDGKLARNEKSAILVNMAIGDGLFAELVPPIGSTVQQVINGRVLALPTPAYEPQDEDVLLFTVARGDETPPKLNQIVRAAADRYLAVATERLKAEGRKPVNGMLTVEGRLAQGDDPGAVTFLVDGQVVAIQNRAPFSIRWDTRNWENGEHLIEVRALDRQGAKLTSKRTLVIVDNKT